MKRTLFWKSLILFSLSGLILGTVAIGLCQEKEGSFVEKELYAVDAKSTATVKKWLSGKGIMEKEKLWNHIAKVLTGVEGKRTYVLATSMDNIPLSTTIEFYIDPGKKILYGFSEKGTEKLIHMKNNPKVSLSWHEEFMNDFSKTLCVQIRGTAELFEGDCPEMDEALKFYRYQYMPWNFIPTRNAPTALIVEPLQMAMAQVIKKNIMLVKVTIEQAVITDMRLIGEGYEPRQIWRRR
jgi:nitroimidazol reductase NimA-like FMN-containing flavoprotein (pyridoxamine 5'-phosphate oxidase superfamily)